MTPDKPFIEFAREFAKNFNLLSPGLYQSDDKETSVVLAEVLKDGSKESTTPTRVNAETGEIELSRRVIKSYALKNEEDAVFAFIVWSKIRYECVDEVEADAKALGLWIACSYDAKDFYEQWVKVFVVKPTKINVEREKRIWEFINKSNGGQ